jgi:hypothetical protein
MKDSNFIQKFIGKLDQSILKEIQDKLSKENEATWDKYNFRKGYTGHSQENTKCIPLYWISNNWLNLSKCKPVCIYRFIEFESYFAFLERIHELLKINYPNTILYQVAFTKLSKNKDIYPHSDCTERCAYPHRIHVSIQTDPNVKFYIHNIAHHFAEGEIVEINNTLIHSVENHSSFDRIHLLIDIIHIDHLPYGGRYKDLRYKDRLMNREIYFGSNGTIRPNCDIPIPPFLYKSDICTDEHLKQNNHL